MTMQHKNHDLAGEARAPGVIYEEEPLLDRDGSEVPGLHAVRIALDNPRQLNSYTTDMIKGVILGMKRASNDRACVAVVFTGTGEKAFCTGGNTEEYAEYYAGRPGEYRQYMRLFNDMVTAILHCDKPVVCRVNGMRIAGGQEIGMACDFSVAQDLAIFGQAGPKHGSAPDGGSTDFLPLMVGVERAMESCTLSREWSRGFVSTASTSRTPSSSRTAGSTSSAGWFTASSRRVRSGPPASSSSRAARSTSQSSTKRCRPSFSTSPSPCPTA
jgi:6-oxo-cyclohex-1-ene-carbonyl-CoA hydrolase